MRKMKRILGLFLSLMLISMSIPPLLLTEVQAATAGDGTYTWPVSTSYGISNAYTTSHGGCDIALGIGSSVYAVADGTVVLANDYGCQGSHGSVNSGACPLGSSCQAVIKTGKSHGSYANWIIIDHGSNVYSLYAHLKTGTFTVSQGQSVKQGQQIACSGNAGNTSGNTGAHLHFELRIGANSQSYSVNPANYLTKINVTPVTYADLGTDFTAPILNKAAWKPIENSYTESDKPPVRIQTENGKANQLWYFSRQSDGSYMISSCQDGKYLDVRDAGTGTGVVIQTCVASGSDAQKWYLYEKDGGYIIKSKLSGYVLDLVNNDSTSGNTLQTWENNGTTAQIWAIYRGDECKLKGPTLTVTAGDSKSNTKFTWTEVYGESEYDVKIWKGTVWDGDAYHIKWGATSGYSLTLPAGTYQAYVDAANYYDIEMGNLVTFTVSEHQHSYSYKLSTSPTTSATGKLTGTCSKCSGTTTVTLPKLNTTDYTYKVVTAATCTANGTGRYTWKTTTYGNYYFDVTIAKLGHSYSYKASTSPTTSTTGKLTGTCSKCSGTTTVTLPKLNTTDYTYKVVTAATCTANGTGRYTWNTTTYGSYYFDVTITKTGHSYISAVTAPTCTEQGYTTYTCSTCGNSYKDSYTTALGHSYSYKVSITPTVSTAGSLTSTCSRCSGTTMVTLPKLNTTDYTYKVVTAATCTTNGTGRYTWNTTSYGGYYFDVVLNKIDHTYQSTVTVPTCTEMGYTTHTCACGDSYTDNYVDALGHTEVIDEAVFSGCNEPYLTEGSHCSVCGEVLIAQVYQPATGHDYRSGVCIYCGEADPNYSTTNKIASGWSGDLTWVLTDDGVLTFSGTGAMKNYTYKSEMPWYSYMDQITSVVIESGATRIGSYAFYGMNKLECIEIPETVTAIGDYAFKNATAIDDVVLPSGLSSLGDSAFYGCTNLSAIDIPASLYTVKPYTFKNCTSLAEVTFHEGNLMKLSDGAFYGTALTEVEFPACLDIIDVYCFKNCSKLESITIPEGDLTQIREAVFYGTAIPSLTIPEGVAKVGPYAFKNCANLETVSLPATLTSVGEASFYACTALKSMDIPDAVTTIGNYAFRRCTAMTGVTFGSELTDIGESSFYGCSGLTSLNIPDKVTTIQGYAFKGCTGLTSVKLGSSVTTIGESAFHTCTGIKTIVIPASVETIGAYCFSGSYNLWQITFEGNAPSIGSSAFKGLAATAYYPADDSSWTSDVMQNYGGTITWKIARGDAAEDDTTDETVVDSGICGDNLTWSLDTNGVLTISGTGKMDNYDIISTTLPDTAEGLESLNYSPWCLYRADIQKVVIEEGVTSVGTYAFYNIFYNITEVELPDTLVNIYRCAFHSCPITSIEIPYGVDYIGYMAFSSTELTSVVVPDSVTEFDQYVFAHCDKLESVKLSENLVSIPAYTFLNCEVLTELEIPSSVTSLGYSAFGGCDILKTLTIPASVTKMGNKVFYAGATSEITFLGDAPTFSSETFSAEIMTVYYPANNATWTTDIMQDYGGTVTWIAVDEDGNAVVTASEEAAAVAAEPEETVPEETEEEETVPEETVEEEETPDETVAVDTIPEDTIPAETEVSETQSEETIFTETESTENVPEETVTEEVTNETESSETVPTETVAEETSSEETETDTTVPNETTAAETIRTETETVETTNETDSE